MDQIEKIHAITGTPSPEILATMKRRSTHVEFDFPHKVLTHKALTLLQAICFDLPCQCALGFVDMCSIYFCNVRRLFSQADRAKAYDSSIFLVYGNQSRNNLIQQSAGLAVLVMLTC